MSKRCLRWSVAVTAALLASCAAQPRVTESASVAAADALDRRIPIIFGFMPGTEARPPLLRESAGSGRTPDAARKLPISMQEMMERIARTSRQESTAPLRVLRSVDLTAAREYLSRPSCGSSRIQCRDYAEWIAQQIEQLAVLPRYLTRRDLRVRGIELSDEQFAETRTAVFAARELWGDIAQRLQRDALLRAALVERMGETRLTSARKLIEERFAELGAAEGQSERAR